jgi:hypothetical protein
MFLMCRYHELVGRRIEVQYRAGDVILPATGWLAADSGKSIFLEEKLAQRGQVKSFRWEIPYSCILSVDESFAPAPVVPTEAPEKAKADKSLGFAALRRHIEST